jgi:hypothetical protein
MTKSNKSGELQKVEKSHESEDESQCYDDNEIRVSDDSYNMYMWANAPAAIPHTIARVAAINVNVPLPSPLSPPHGGGGIANRARGG